MKKNILTFVLGIVLGIVLLPICALVYIELGYAPVATAASPMPFEKWLAKSALRTRISREAPRQSPVAANPDTLIAGANIYHDNCAICHGASGQPETPTARGMFPPPPQLLRGKGVTDDPIGETYWKVANGIRLSGMPAYRETLSDTQLWQVSQMLAHATNVPEQAVEVLKSGPGSH